jgi:hypothetical protein
MIIIIINNNATSVYIHANLCQVTDKVCSEIPEGLLSSREASSK